MKFGAEPRKIAIFVGLLAVAGIVFWINSSSDAPAPSASRHTAVDPVAAVAAAPSEPTRVALRRAPQGHVEIGNWEPKLPKSIDPSKVDPTLHLELLAKVQGVQEEGGARNIFQTTAAPPPPQQAADKSKVPPVDVLHPNGQQPPGKASAPPPPPVNPGPPPPPQITWKYFGYSTERSDGEKKAFFLDGDDVIVAAEGEIIKKQYKVVRIKDNSVQIEDTASKSTQTLPLQPEAAPA